MAGALPISPCHNLALFDSDSILRLYSLIVAAYTGLKNIAFLGKCPVHTAPNKQICVDSRWFCSEETSGMNYIPDPGFCQGHAHTHTHISASLPDVSYNTGNKPVLY